MISDEKLAIPEYRIDLLNKNKKIIKKVENVEDIHFKKNHVRNNFLPKKNKRNFKMRNKFKYPSSKKHHVNKKSVNY